MSDSWKQYWPVYRRLEDEFCDFSYFVALEDSHLKVYSIKLSELVLRICAECENIGLSLMAELGIMSKNRMTFVDIGRHLKSRTNLESKSAKVVWHYQSLKNVEISPFKDWSKKNPNWFQDYNDLKHNRVHQQGISCAKHGSVLNGLCALYLLNVELIKVCRHQDEFGSLPDASTPAFGKLFHYL